MKQGVDTTKMFVDNDHVKNYAKYRTRYSEDVFKYIVDYCKETRPDLDLCVDVGCGSGQSTTGFAKYFKKVSTERAEDNRKKKTTKRGGEGKEFLKKKKKLRKV